MNPNLKTAVIQFLADEFQVDPNNLSEDTAFAADLNLSPTQISDLLQRLQDSLNFILPEDKAASITTLGDIFAALEPDDPDSASELS
ncbi:MAG: Acyl carrier protein [Candidatus Amesbacteria bacterium GW2011_GWB1_47_19]|nr:MAG: Acyl carrier protein [Candidatus Amesbacteria bacterium GW2011_GWA1_44_24]KKU31096.1 MAG: Acyl carrier protein [Candidatus Amesbacteria bacterium GW2011_GWC1_46_24]KKU67217.1 MAG: Acyl carrier protein [Candidatus Amesbacteria bacterium GW2011_GWB1_47_19]OGD05776.1 MAG: hypothetical protein A2379_01470 [Candidatus Amesbacteria bacterium RIFOXYB1_FULL_47_13]HBC72633.1 acyl carrier protein [Candidatus Amesbacteria bacterium]